MHDSPVEQARTISAPTRRLGDRDAELGTTGKVGIDRKRQMRHGNQFKTAVVNAKNLVALKIQGVGITLNLLVRGREPETQVSVSSVQGDQMVCDTTAMIDA